MTHAHTDDSYWLATTPAPEHGRLEGDIAVDVAVVGAGIAGISAASELTRAGRSVALLERSRVAAGVTGYTTAKVSVLHGAMYHHLAKDLGDDVAAQYAMSQHLAMRHVADTVERLGVDCDLEVRPAYVFGETDREARHLEAEAEAARRAGVAASFTTDTGLPFPVSGAVRAENQLMFHPRKYLLALVAELVAQGAQIYENTAVTELDEGFEEGTPSVLTCADGSTVTADEVVVATHYPIFDRSLMFARLTPKREFAVAGVVEEADDPPGMYINLDSDTRSIRSAPYDGRRLLIATGSPFTPGDSSAGEKVTALSHWLRDRFPVKDVEYVWATQDNTSPDRVPFIGPLQPLSRHTWVATGFGGWGMTSGVLAGMLLTDLIRGRRPEWAGIYDPRRLHPRAEARSAVKTGTKFAAHLTGSRVRARLESVSSAEEIEPGTAGVVHDHDGSWATFVDEDGGRHSVSSTCTHMGCLVSFNDVERAWECPCHGSRFALDGAVLQGPATQPLREHPGLR